LVTFNFINIAWVFFRAKEWEDAVKVLSGMVAINNIVLPDKVAGKLSFLSEYGITFGQWLSATTGNIWTVFWLFVGFILIILFKNSTEKLENFKLNYKTALLASIAFAGGTLSLNKVSEFLYFNF